VTAPYGASTANRRSTRADLAELHDIIVDIVDGDAPLTLRGLFYRCVSAGAVEKTELAYRRVGRELLKLRRDGRVSYRDITDGTRIIFKDRSFDGVEDALRNTARTYRRALWSSSPYNLVLLSEKDAITGAILNVVYEWDITLGVVRGYGSESFAWKVGDGLDPNRINVVAQLGDHDPSGVHAWKDFATKLTDFADGKEITLERLAVTADQIVFFGLPTRPTKTTDPRYRGWTGGSVEVDAIDAPTLRSIVENWIRTYVDADQLDRLLIIEDAEREQLEAFAAGWRR
jgi:hypothetical protein